MSHDSFGVYVHFPLCLRRCGYCDFAIIPQDRFGRAFDHVGYTEAVVREIAWRAADYAGRSLRSIYFGGGTPSLWPVTEIQRVIAAVLSHFSAADAIEVTLEANPEDLAIDDLRALRQSGVNRLSLGSQAFSDDMLRRLSRQHTVRDIERAVENARSAGIDNVNCDIIFALREQTVSDYLEQLARLVALNPQHVSTYCLSLSPHAALRRDGEAPLGDDEAAELMNAGRDYLAAHEFLHYEVSNFAKPGAESIHNQDVWRGLPYLGVGAAAHSQAHRLLPTRQLWSIANPPYTKYLRSVTSDGPPRHLSGARMERIDTHRRANDLLMLGLRTRAGVARHRYREEIGLDIVADLGQPLTSLVENGMLAVTSDAVVPTAQGIWFADELALKLIQQRDARAVIHDVA